MTRRKFSRPATRTKNLLTRIWTDVFKVEKVEMEENLFDLGEHFLLAIRVRDAFKLELPMAAFFEAPTIGGMLVALGRIRKTKGMGTGGIRRVARVAATDELLAKLNSNPG